MIDKDRIHLGITHADQLLAELREEGFNNLFRINEVISHLREVNESVEGEVFSYQINTKDFQIVLALAACSLVQVIKSKFD